jgi:hypothetical protein
MLDIVRVALGNGVAGVISAASVLLGTIILFSGSGVSDCLDEFLSLEVELLKSCEGMRMIHPHVVNVIAIMFDSAGESANGYEQELFGLMQMVRQAEFNIEDLADVQYANDLFKNVCRLYRVFAKWFYPKMDRVGAAERPKVLDWEEKCIWEMLALASRLGILGEAGHLAEFVIREFADMARQFAEHCSRRNNVVLNHASVHRVLAFGQQIDQRFQLREKCKLTVKYLETR